MTRVLLTTEQQQRYEQLFAIAAQDGLTDTQADRDAWRGLCEEWPELREFVGAQS